MCLGVCVISQTRKEKPPAASVSRHCPAGPTLLSVTSKSPFFLGSFWVCASPSLHHPWPDSYIPTPKQAREKNKQASNHQIRRQRRAKRGGAGRGRMGQCPCFGSAKAAEQERRAEADRQESQEARSKAAEAAQRR